MTKIETEAVRDPRTSNLAERLEVAAADMLYYKGGKRGMPNPVFFENVSTLLSEAAEALREVESLQMALDAVVDAAKEEG